MSSGPDDPSRDTTSQTIGGVSSAAIQARDIEGGVHIHHASRRVITLPHRAGVPPSRASAFQARETTDRLADALERGEAAVLTSDTAAHTGVVSGLGGVGKTQVAVDYAERLWAAGALELLAWVTAGSRDGIVSTYARLAADLTGVDDLSPEYGAVRLLEWLAGTTASWLVVLDDVQNPGDLRGLWPPATRGGRVVVTTRRRDAALRGHGRRLIEVDVFTPREARAYLDTALTDQPNLRDDIDGLADALGYLPLALAQASAYLLDRGLSCAAYRQRFTDRQRRLATLIPESDGLPDEHRATVAATWSLSVEQANRLAPVGVAGPLLEIASLLNANGIPAELFTAPAILDLLTSSTGRDIGEEEARDGLGALLRLSLIAWDREMSAATVRVHGLVQRATLDGLPADRLPVVVRTAADALRHVWPNVERDTAFGQLLRSNAEALTNAGGQHLWVPDAHAVLFRAGQSTGEAGLASDARNYFEQLLHVTSGYLGPDHLDTLITRHNLAYWRGEAGDPSGAVTALEQLLADRLRVLGQDHPHTLTARHNLAYWRGKAGDPSGAVTALEQLLADQLRVQDKDHPHTLTARHNLAYWRGEAGDLAGAVTAFEQLLADRLRVQGPDHPHTLATRYNLAMRRGEAGDPASAVSALEQLLDDRLRVLGQDHPHTLTTRHGLAMWRGEAGDRAGAVTAFEQLLDDRLRVLGPDHPDTATTRNSLARWKGDRSDTADS